jgi:hypothetical protein
MLMMTRKIAHPPSAPTRSLLILSVLLAACAGREPEMLPAEAGAAVVRNSIRIGLVETTFFVVDSVDGTKVHEEMDFKRNVEIAAGKRELTVSHYTDALWGSRQSAETCTIVVDAEPNRVYELQGAAERGEWRARLVDRQTARESPCLFPDEIGSRAAKAAENEPSEPSAPPAAADAGPGEEKPEAVAAATEAANGGSAAGNAAAEAKNQATRRRSFCPRGFYRVARLDGSATFVLERSDRVRLIGVQPHTVDSKPSDTDTVNVEGKCVRFDYEPTNLIDGHRDRDGRLLAYVYLEDGTFVNLELIREGHARASDERHQHLAEFLAAQSVARKAGVGVWLNSAQ